MDCVAIVCIVVAIVVALVIGIGQIYIARKMDALEKRRDKRDEKRRYDEIYAEATRYIQKYSYIYKYLVPPGTLNPVYPYRREIYRDFCTLTAEVQNEIIKRLDFYIRRYERTDTYYADILKRIMDAI